MILERVNATPARWWSLVGLLLVPLLIAGGFLIAGLNSDSRLHTVKAAVVNLDDPVTIDGQYIPLGRQLTANLVDSDRTQNLTWTLDSEENARAGLANGSYAAMVIIPKNFSAAATSYAKDAADAERATIELSTSPVAGVADATLGKSVAMAAATSLNETLTSGYLDKIYLGFNDLGDSFTTMADGADQLASGLEVMHTKIATMPADTDKLASGTAQYVGGVNQLVDKTIASLPQQVELADGVHQLSEGASGVSGGLSTYQSQMDDLGSNTTVVATASAAAVNAAAAAVPCPTFSADPTTQATYCAIFTQGRSAGAQVGAATGVTVGGKAAAAGLDTTDKSTGQSLKSGAAALAGGMSQLDAQLAASVPDVASTTKDLKKLKTGGNDLADGTRQLADGMPALVDGVGQLATGSRKLADGIAEGKDKLPTYTTSERENLSEVVAAPVSTDGLSGLADPNIGWVSLLLVLALWVGAMATYVVLQPVGRALLGSAEPTAKLVAEALAPGAGILAAQAIVMGSLAHLALDLTWPKTAAVTGVLVLASLAFALINHALVSWLSGAGRLIAVAFAVITTAASLAPAAPGLLTALRPFSPVTTALDAIRAVLTESSGAALLSFSVAGWLVVALIASAVGIARHRTTTLEAVLAA